ncbi:MAG: GxxExxY protein [Alphaproteobacteria bacterium]
MSSAIQKYDDMAPDLNDLSGQIVDCAFQVHRELGAGFLESNYEDALVYELSKKSLFFERQKSFTIPYKDTVLKSEFRFDLIVENKILVELKSVDKIHPVHQAQIYAYLKATKMKLGLLINFNVPLIKNGIGRYVLRNSETPR